MYFVSADFSDRTEHISFITRVTWGILAFWPIYFGSIWWSRKGPSFWFLLGVFSLLGSGRLWSTLFLWQSCTCDLVGVLPSSSSFFSAFSILLHWVSSLLMAAPLLRSINLEVEMSNFAATSRMVLGLYFSPKRFLLFFSKPCQFMYPMARTLRNSSSLPSSCKSSSAHGGTLVEGHGVACTD